MVTLGEEEFPICSQELQILIAAIVANSFNFHRVNEWITDEDKSAWKIDIYLMILQCEGNTREVSCFYEFSSSTVIGVWFSYNQLSIISLHCCIPINYNSTANCVTYAILPVLSYCLPYFMTHHTKNRIDYRTIPCFHSFNLLSHMPAFGCFVMMVIHMYS